MVLFLVYAAAREETVPTRDFRKTHTRQGDATWRLHELKGARHRAGTQTHIVGPLGNLKEKKSAHLVQALRRVTCGLGFADVSWNTVVLLSVVGCV